MTANVAVAAPIPVVTQGSATVTVTVPNAASTSVTTQPMSFRYGTRVGQLWPRGGSQETSVPVDDDTAIPVATHEPLGIEDASNVSITVNNATRVVTVAPVSGAWTYWMSGVEVPVASARTVTLDNTTGTWYCYFDDTTATLRKSLTPWSLSSTVPVAAVYWDAVKSEGVIWNERHGIVMDWATHLRMHQVDGTKVVSGFAASGYALSPGSPADADNNVAIATGVLADEDLDTTVAALDGTTYRVWYRSGASGDWTWDTTTVPLLSAGSYAQYNQWTGATWTKTACANGDYMNVYLIATPAITTNQGIIAVPGQAVHATLSAAQNESINNLAFGTLPFTEMAALYRVSLRMGASYATTGKCRIEGITRIVGSSVNITQTGISSHSGLSGLTDANAHPASSVSASTASFDNVLTPTESTVQLALDQIDDAAAQTAGVVMGAY